MSPGEHAAQLRGIWVRMGREAVLRDLNLDVAAGEGVVLLGENGAGKTTLLRLLAGALSAARGEGRVSGFDLRDRRSVREHTHLLSHEMGLYPDLTPRENVEFALSMYGVQGDVNGALGRVGLARAADRRVRYLSAGMRKRAALARVSLLRPLLLLVDEPFANLDEAGRALAGELLLEARGRGSALVVAAHEPELAAPLAHRVLRLAGGQLTPEGAVHRVAT